MTAAMSKSLPFLTASWAESCFSNFILSSNQDQITSATTTTKQVSADGVKTAKLPEPNLSTESQQHKKTKAKAQNKKVGLNSTNLDK